MLHVFPEVDSKHSESEWNQDSDHGRSALEANEAYLTFASLGLVLL
jgi:hypothetical protein